MQESCQIIPNSIGTAPYKRLTNWYCSGQANKPPATDFIVSLTRERKILLRRKIVLGRKKTVRRKMVLGSKIRVEVIAEDITQAEDITRE